MTNRCNKVHVFTAYGQKTQGNRLKWTSVVFIIVINIICGLIYTPNVPKCRKTGWNLSFCSCRCLWEAASCSTLHLYAVIFTLLGLRKTNSCLVCEPSGNGLCFLRKNWTLASSTFTLQPSPLAVTTEDAGMEQLPAADWLTDFMLSLVSIIYKPFNTNAPEKPSSILFHQSFYQLRSSKTNLPKAQRQIKSHPELRFQLLWLSFVKRRKSSSSSVFLTIT